MELEKAIRELKRTIEENNRLLLPHNEQFFNKKEKKEIEQQSNAIKTVLKILDNSIPKEKVEDKIEIYKRLGLASFNRDSIQADEYRAIIKVLQDLLEE